MQPNSSTSPTGQGPTGRSFLLIMGALLGAILLIGVVAVSALNAVTAPAAAAAARPSSSAWPKPSAKASPSPSPSPEATIEPTAQPTPEPTAVPEPTPAPEPTALPPEVLLANWQEVANPSRAELGSSLIVLFAHVGQLAEEPELINGLAWRFEYGGRRGMVETAADKLRGLTAPAGKEAEQQKLFDAAGEAYRITSTLDEAIDAARIGDGVTSEQKTAAALAAWEAYKVLMSDVNINN